MIDWDEFKPLFIYLFISVQVSEFSVRYVWVSWKLRPWETMKEKKFFLSLKMFYGHAMLIGGKPERIEIFIVSGLSLSRPVDTKADLKLNNIIATPSSNLILTPLDECQSWWALTIRDMRPWRYNLCALWLVRCKLPLRHWNLRNLTLQQECLPYKTFLSSTRDFYRLHSTFARLYNAAASPASRLRSAGSLAIMGLCS